MIQNRYEINQKKSNIYIVQVIGILKIHKHIELNVP